MKFSVLLPEAPKTLQLRLQRLINQSLGTSSSDSKNKLPQWRPDFYNVHLSPFWNKLSENQKELFLNINAKSILKEAISIEHAGIAYANKMALLSETQEERQYYTTVAFEELNHLISLQPYFEFQVNHDVPAFSQMIADIIETETRRDSILLIQVLLEGWGISHYQSLLSGTDNSELKSIFSKIIMDETRHHGGGIILVLNHGIDFSVDLISKIQVVIDAIRVGPFQVATLLAELNSISTEDSVVDLLTSIQASETTVSKLKIVQQNIGKVLTSTQMSYFNWTPLPIAEMSQLICQCLKSSISENPTITSGL